MTTTTDPQRVLLSMTDHQPKPGAWLLACSGVPLQVVGPSPADSTLVPCTAEDDAEPVLLPRHALTWPPVSAPAAARSAPAAIVPAPAVLPAPVRASAPTPTPATALAAAALAAPKPHSAHQPGVAARATMERPDSPEKRTAALLRARVLSERIVAIYRTAQAQGRPLSMSKAIQLADRELQASDATKH